MVSAGGEAEAELVEAELGEEVVVTGVEVEVGEVGEVEAGEEEVVAMKFAMMPMRRTAMKSWRQRVKRKNLATGGAL